MNATRHNIMDVLAEIGAGGRNFDPKPIFFDVCYHVKVSRFETHTFNIPYVPKELEMSMALPIKTPALLKHFSNLFSANNWAFLFYNLFFEHQLHKSAHTLQPLSCSCTL